MSHAEVEKTFKRDLSFIQELKWTITDVYANEKHIQATLISLGRELNEIEEKIEAEKKENAKKLEEKRKIIVEKMKDYFEIWKVIREIRARWLPEILKNKEYESWCNGKHFLGQIGEFMECAIKAFCMGDLEKAIKLVRDASISEDVFLILQKLSDKYGKS